MREHLVGSRVRLLLPLVHADPRAAPLDFLDETARRLSAFCALLDRGAGPSETLASSEAARVAIFLRDELPAAASALAQVAGLLEGTLGVGDPRVGPLQRLARELGDCGEQARRLGRELIGNDLRPTPQAWPKAADLSRQLSRTLPLTREFALPLARRRLSTRERWLLGQRL